MRFCAFFAELNQICQSFNLMITVGDDEILRMKWLWSLRFFMMKYFAMNLDCPRWLQRSTYSLCGSRSNGDLSLGQAMSLLQSSGHMLHSLDGLGDSLLSLLFSGGRLSCSSWLLCILGGHDDVWMHSKTMPKRVGSSSGNSGNFKNFHRIVFLTELHCPPATTVIEERFHWIMNDGHSWIICIWRSG